MMTLVPVALAALLAGADPGFDTVFLQNGGRVRGTVVEEDPTRGVTIQVPGGQVRTVPPAEVFRIEYRDGTIGALGARPPPEPPPAAAPVEPAPAARPEQPAWPAEPRSVPPDEPPSRPAPPPPPGWTGRPLGEPVRPLNPGALRPGPPRPQLIMLAASLGFAVPGGDVEPGVPMSEVTSTQFLMGLEGGLRLSPEVMLGLYMDIGVGGAVGAQRDNCRLVGTSCSTADVRLGFMARYVFTPLAPQTAWIGIGTGFDVLVVSTDDSRGDGPSWGGWEALRLSAGYDLRGSGQVGIGFFVTGSFGRYSDVDDSDGRGFVSLPSTSSHSWVQAGVRFILFP